MSTTSAAGGVTSTHVEVFRRQGQPCDVCGTLIARTKVAGRATSFCPRCQQP